MVGRDTRGESARLGPEIFIVTSYNSPCWMFGSTITRARYRFI